MKARSSAGKVTALSVSCRYLPRADGRDRPLQVPGQRHARRADEVRDDVVRPAFPRGGSVTNHSAAAGPDGVRRERSDLRADESRAAPACSWSPMRRPRGGSCRSRTAGTGERLVEALAREAGTPRHPGHPLGTSEIAQSLRNKAGVALGLLETRLQVGRHLLRRAEVVGDMVVVVMILLIDDPPASRLPDAGQSRYLLPGCS